jgi:HlyD family secretion protein
MNKGIGVAVALGAALLLGACERNRETPPLQGYVEGDFVLLAAPAAGWLEKLYVQRGQTLAQGEPVFTLEHAAEDAAKREALERLKAAEERAANLRGSRRPPEIEASTAQAAQARASRELSELQLKQQEKLFAAGFISKAQMDAARTTYERDIARVRELEAQGRLARESVGREAEIRGAAAEVDAARALVAQADWRLAQRGADAPSASLVQDLYFRQGEFVPAGRPIVSLLPPQNVKLRFFVPETLLGALKPGDPVTVSCDGCGAPITARISFISTQAEYTPPVIYSQGSREKLVFMIEARPDLADAPRLRPGQPVDVRRGSGTAAGTDTKR